MKTSRLFHRLLAAFWIVCLLALTGVVLIAQPNPGIRTPSIPLIVKNGPTGLTNPAWNQIESGGPVEISFKNAAGGLTNLHLHAYFANVISTNGNIFLTTGTTAPATNYFEVPSGSGYLTGNDTVALGTNGNYWTAHDFELKTSQFQTNNRGDSLLLFLGVGQTTNTAYQAAYAYVVDSAVASTNFYSPITTTVTTNRITAGQKYKISIYAPEGAATNMTFRTYFATIATNGTNGVTNYALTNLPGFPDNLDPSYFTSGTGLYTGTNVVQLSPGGWVNVEFQLDAASLTDNEVEDCLLVFLGLSTNSSYRLETAYILPLDSPFEAPVPAVK